MNTGLRNLIKKSGVYYPLLIAYHAAIDELTKIKYRILYLSKKGNGFTCNFCGAVYNRFVDKPVPLRYHSAIVGNQVVAGYCDNCFCPNCLSTARKRLLKLAIEKYFVLPGCSLLHFAPEKSIYALLQPAFVTTVDLEPDLYRHVDKKIQFADATALSFTHDQFDYLIACHILEHIPNDLKAMSEMYRVLKPGGKAILQSPYSETLPNTIEDITINNPEQQVHLFGQEDHVRIYSLNNYVARLQSVGFDVSVIEQSSLCGEDCSENFTLQPGEKLILVTKP